MKKCNKIIYLSVSAALASWSIAGWAGGFGIGTQSGSGTGNAFAGGAAAAEDASVAWSNPAGMTALPGGTHITTALHVLKPSFKFQNSGSTGIFANAGTGDGGDGGGWAAVPNGFIVSRITPSLSLGFAVNAPFGLKTEYDNGWRGQLLALKSEIKTFNFNPSIAYKVSDNFSIGVGLSAQRILAELTNANLPPAGGTAKLSASDWGWGWNVGLTFLPTNDTRIGFHYRSAIEYTLDGTATFSAPAAAAAGSPVQAALKVPDSFSLSFLTRMNDKWDIMGDYTYTGWSSVQQLVVRRSGAVAPGTTFTTLPFFWEDTVRLGMGLNYRMNSQTKLRFGAAYDRTPTNNLTRSPRLPDESRTWVALGVQYKPFKQGTFEFGYAHEFIRDARINNPTAAGSLVGSYKNKADIISLQYTHSF
jgi:long-chain fatty acid transport protein